MTEPVEIYRTPGFPVDYQFWQRWSPRAFTGEAIREDQLMSLFEAARWAPSCFNEQPWRFLYAQRDSSDWQLFLDLLMEGNQAWAENSSALIVVLSKKSFSHNGKPNGTHSFDCGAAWQNIALQAALMGLATHGMAGIHYQRIADELNVPDDFNVEMMIAVGVPASADTLEESLREREKPSDRKAVTETCFAGRFPED
ncbi:MAG: nitroreductase family protein [Motiliproteus sp.]|nr:nitroreductase family protein [Motiliproteus sp.]MCW9051764.1 nitroreductase family protein [Motiliproteus sp.]